MELLSPAGSPEALRAAVQNGADAVYLGYGDFNARRNAKNFSSEEFAAAVSYCHVRGVKVYLTLNTLLTDRELPGAYDTASFAAQQGIDAILVQDLGLAKALREGLPQISLHASTQMTIHNLPGTQFCRDFGMGRVVLSRELSRQAVAYLAANAPVEVEVFVHGALCMCYSGQCYFSALLGGRSGNRGLCAQPCRLAYRWEDETQPGYPLSLKDLSLSGYLGELSELGVACLKLEGRMKRPEYVAIVTGIFAQALREGREPTEEEHTLLAQVFSRDGFTQGYYLGAQDSAMFGRRREGVRVPEALYAKARESYEGRERRQIPLAFTAVIRGDGPVRLTATDPEGRTATALGPVPEPARNRALRQEQVRAQLCKTGGTVFSCGEVTVTLEEGLSLPVSALNALRRQALDEMAALRSQGVSFKAAPFAPGPTVPPISGPPGLGVCLHQFSQLSPALLALGPDMVWLPVEDIAAHSAAVQAFRQSYPGVTFGAVLPRIVWDAQLPLLASQLQTCRDIGLTDVLLGNWGLAHLCRPLGFRLHGDYGLGVSNSLTLGAMNDLGFTSATVSFELNLSQIRDLQTPLPTALIAYGRLPLMLMEHCLVRRSGGDCHCQVQPRLVDRKGERFPVLRQWGCRSALYNAKTLYLADKLSELAPLGLSELRLLFTTESPADCAAILAAYQGKAGSVPQAFTRGLYSRKVE